MKIKWFLTLAVAGYVTLPILAEDITTLDGHTFADVRDVAVKRNGLFFVAGAGTELKGVTLAFTNLPDALKEKYHYDPYEMGLMAARQTPMVYLTKNLAFSLDQLEAAKKKAHDEKKLIGFIMEWDSMLVPSQPMGGAGSNSGLAHFYAAFKDSLVLVFVRHENELGKVPDAVNGGGHGGLFRVHLRDTVWRREGIHMADAGKSFSRENCGDQEICGGAGRDEIGRTPNADSGLTEPERFSPGRAGQGFCQGGFQPRQAVGPFSGRTFWCGDQGCAQRRPTKKQWGSCRSA